MTVNCHDLYHFWSGDNYTGACDCGASHWDDFSVANLEVEKLQSQLSDMERLKEAYREVAAKASTNDPAWINNAYLKVDVEAKEIMGRSG